MYLKTYYYIFAILLTLINSVVGYSQNVDTSLQQLDNLPSNYLTSVDGKISSVESHITKQSIKYLHKFRKQELRLQRDLMRRKQKEQLDVFSGVQGKYTELENKIRSKSALSKKISGQYNSYLDTLTASLSFLRQFRSLSDKAGIPFTHLRELENKFHEADVIKQFIAERKTQLKELLSGYTKLPSCLKNEYDKLNKTAFYFSAQIAEYKNMLRDPEKIEKKVLAILKEIPAFQKFMKANSQVASLFGIPADYGTAQNIGGLQTLSSVQALIRQQISMSGNGGMQQFQQNLGQARTEMNTLKDKINKLGGGNSDKDLPDFKPSNQKTKSFLKRLEYGANVQIAKSKLLGSTSDLAISLGYKLNDKSVAGIGLSYRANLGSFQHITFTSEGVGIRSFMDWILKRQIYISGGFEMNYNKSFRDISQLKDESQWQQSALLGLSKRYKLGGKVKGNLQFMYDFLYRSHLPFSSPIIYRLGYLLK